MNRDVINTFLGKKVKVEIVNDNKRTTRYGELLRTNIPGRFQIENERGGWTFEGTDVRLLSENKYLKKFMR